MAATFGNLDLESLGVVGEPSVEYASFETKVSQPDGYDGGVLANFRRGATKIKFNLALDGDRGSIVAKMNQLAAELSKGQQELVLPNMTEGYHFDASANCALQPVEYVDGFVLPLEFVVPEGCAVRNRSITESIHVITNIEVGGEYPPSYKVEFESTTEYTGRVSGYHVLSFEATPLDGEIGWHGIGVTPKLISPSGTGTIPPASFVIDSGNMSLNMTPAPSEANNVRYILTAGAANTLLETLPTGTVSIQFVVGYQSSLPLGIDSATLSWQEASVW